MANSFREASSVDQVHMIALQEVRSSCADRRICGRYIPGARALWLEVLCRAPPVSTCSPSWLDSVAEALGGDQQRRVAGPNELSQACFGELDDVLVAVFDGGHREFGRVSGRFVRIRHLITVRRRGEGGDDRRRHLPR